MNTYCWIHSTYTVVDAFMKKQGQEVPFPGVDNSQRSGALTIRHTKYYQWVAFTLFFQVSRIVSGRGMKAFCPPHHLATHLTQSHRLLHPRSSPNVLCCWVRSIFFVSLCRVPFCCHTPLLLFDFEQYVLHSRTHTHAHSRRNSKRQHPRYCIALTGASR